MPRLRGGDRLHQDGEGEDDAGESGERVLHPGRRAEHLRHDHRRGGAGPGAGLGGQGDTGADRVHQPLRNLSGAG